MRKFVLHVDLGNGNGNDNQKQFCGRKIERPDQGTSRPDGSGTVVYIC